MPELSNESDLAEVITLPDSSLQLTRLTTDPDLQSPRSSSSTYSPAARKQLISTLEEQWIQAAFPILNNVATFHDDDLYCLWRSCEGLIDVLTFALKRLNARNVSYSSIEQLGAAIIASKATSRRLPSLFVLPSSSSRSPSCLSPIDCTSSAHNRHDSLSVSEHVSPINRLPTVRPGSAARTLSLCEPFAHPPTLLPTLPASPVHTTRKRASTSPHHYVEDRSPTSKSSPTTFSPSQPYKRPFHRSLVSIPSMGDEEKQPSEQPTIEDRILGFLHSRDGASLLECDTSSITLDQIQPFIVKHSHLTSGALFLALRSIPRMNTYPSLEELFEVVCRHANRTFVLDLLRCSSIFGDSQERVELRKRDLDALASLNISHLNETVALMDAGNVRLGKINPVNELMDIVSRFTSTE